MGISLINSGNFQAINNFSNNNDSKLLANSFKTKVSIDSQNEVWFIFLLNEKRAFVPYENKDDNIKARVFANTIPNASKARLYISK